ncbi:MAG TPA: hypothetical protein ENK84_07235 [Desulfobulbus sp.]|nr:hypothetical protein [Desulfobulbus sp.]
MDCLMGLQKKDIEKLSEFIFQRRKDDGAFAACPSLPSTVADTFYALKMLKKLDDHCENSPLFSRIDGEKIRAFVRAHTAIRASLPLRVRFFLQEIFRMVTKDLVTEEGISSSIDPCDDLDVGKRLSYENYYYVGRLAAHLQKKFQVDDFHLGNCTGKDVYFYLLLFAEEAETRTAEIGDWLQRCQNCDGGFGFFPGTTSYIEYSDYSLSALSILHRQPLHCRQAGQYILACRTAAGGFSRSTKAAPFLDASYHALNALFCLQSFMADQLRP